MDTMLDNLEKELGWMATIYLTGPVPNKNGKLEMFV